MTDRFDETQHNNLVAILAKAWEELDATELLNYIHPDFRYDSQWVFAWMNAAEYSRYIVG